MNKRILLIGLEPTLIRYNEFPGLNPQKVLDGLKDEVENGLKLGYEIELCLIRPDGGDINTITEKISQKEFDCIVIGAGIRIGLEYFLLFEKVINLAHQAQGAKICFNTNPTDTLKAISRWV
ncbi:MAG: hypothetical protein EB161_06225 [Nitrosopumilaceae archaeon]|nr:hypothetical protein [Nitrosopumilaceae archaeon]NDB87542.1 hypothetical protein [Nitrososphaerota archaeon]